MRLAVAFMTLVACGGGGDSSGSTQPKVDLTPVSIAASNTSLTAVSGSAVAVAVHLFAANGQPSPGATVGFTVTGGGGSVDPSSATTNATGDATATWTLGKVAGANALTVTSGRLSALVISATGTVGPPAVIVPSTTTVTGFFGRAATPSPSLTVTDANENPVSGVTVTFGATAGSGTLTGAVATTDTQGKAQLGSWLLGDSPGQQMVTATIAGLNPITFQATAKNPWSATKPAANETDATVFADEGSVSGGGPPWSATPLLNPPSLIVSCLAPIIYVDVSAPLLITQSGSVTYRFDGGAPESSNWNQLGPNFNVLFFPTQNPASASAFIDSLTHASLFNIAFRDRSGAAYAPNFNMHGLTAIIAQTMAACPGFSGSRAP